MSADDVVSRGLAGRRCSGKNIGHPLVIILVILLPHLEARVFENGVYVVTCALKLSGMEGVRGPMSTGEVEWRVIFLNQRTAKSEPQKAEGALMGRPGVTPAAISTNVPAGAP